MKITKRIAFTATATVGGLALLGPAIALPPGTEDFNKSEPHVVATCGDNNEHELIVVAPDNLWPPNHKYYGDLAVIAVDGNTGEGTNDIDLTSRGEHDQYVDDGSGQPTEMNGSGGTVGSDITVDDEDADLVKNDDEGGDPQVIANEMGNSSVQTDWKARSERSGRDMDGRQYTLGGTAIFDDGSECSGEYVFTVPHDMRKSNRNGGEPTDGSESKGNSKGKSKK